VIECEMARLTPGDEGGVWFDSAMTAFAEIVETCAEAIIYYVWRQCVHRNDAQHTEKTPAVQQLVAHWQQQSNQFQPLPPTPVTPGGTSFSASFRETQLSAILELLEQSSSCNRDVMNVL